MRIFAGYCAKLRDGNAIQMQALFPDLGGTLGIIVMIEAIDASIFRHWVTQGLGYSIFFESYRMQSTIQITIWTCFRIVDGQAMEAHSLCGCGEQQRLLPRHVNPAKSRRPLLAGSCPKQLRHRFHTSGQFAFHTSFRALRRMPVKR